MRYTIYHRIVVCCVSHVSTLDFCDVHTSLDCLNDSACDEKRRECMALCHEMEMESTVTEQCKADEDIL